MSPHFAIGLGWPGSSRRQAPGMLGICGLAALDHSHAFTTGDGPPHQTWYEWSGYGLAALDHSHAFTTGDGALPRHPPPRRLRLDSEAEPPRQGVPRREPGNATKERKKVDRMSYASIFAPQGATQLSPGSRPHPGWRAPMRSAAPSGVTQTDDELRRERRMADPCRTDVRPGRCVAPAARFVCRRNVTQCAPPSSDPGLWNCAPLGPGGPAGGQGRAEGEPLERLPERWATVG